MDVGDVGPVGLVGDVGLVGAVGPHELWPAEERPLSDGSPIELLVTKVFADNISVTEIKRSAG